jgi:hypothetical protein
MLKMLLHGRLFDAERKKKDEIRPYIEQNQCARIR